MAVTRISQSSLKQGLKKNKNFVADIPQDIGKFDSISTITLSSPSSTITFSNIPQTYQHLQLRIMVRGTSAASVGWGFMRMNSQATGSSYYIHGHGTAIDSYSYINSGAPLTFYYPLANSTSSVFEGVIVDILDYKSTSKNKTARIFYGYDANGSGIVGTSSLLYTSLTAVDQITFHSWDSASFSQYSTFSLYGVKV